MKCFSKSLLHLKRPSSLFWLCFFCAGISCHGGSIQWGSGINDTLLNADAAQMPSNFLWELGTFGTSFTPTEHNLTLWQANWKPVEQANWGAGANGGWWTEESHFAGNSTTGYTWVPGAAPDPAPGSNANTWAAGERFYIWAYNSKELGTTSEWEIGRAHV